MATLTQIIEYSKKNPNTEYAKQAYEKIRNGEWDDKAREEGVDLSFAGRENFAQKAVSEEEASLFERMMGGGESFSKGFAKGGLKTLKNAGEFGQEIAQQTVGRVVAPIASKMTGRDISAQDLGTDLYDKNTDLSNKANEFLTPEGGAEGAGYAVEKIAEFLAPAGAVSRGATVASNTARALTTKLPSWMSKTASLGARAGVEGLGAGAISYAQEGELNDSVKTMALLGTAFPIAGAAFKASWHALGRGIGKTGSKIEQTILRPLASDLDNVKMPKGKYNPTEVMMDNIKKHNLYGNAEQTYTQSQILLNEKAKLANEIAKDIDVPVNLKSVAAEVRNKLTGTKSAKFGQLGQGKSFERILNNLDDEIEFAAGKNGWANYNEAVIAKRAAGERGAWKFGSADPDATAIEKVYTAFYKTLREKLDDIAKVTGNSKLVQLNEEMSEIIPISSAALRRMPVDARNNMLSLTDMIGLTATAFDPRALAVLGAKWLSRSAVGAKYMIQAGENMQRLGAGEMGALKTLFLGPARSQADDVTRAVTQNADDAARMAAAKEDVSRGTERVGKIKAFERQQGLSAEDAAIQERAIERVVDNEEELVKQSMKNTGNVVNADEARKLFKNEGYSGINSAAVHEPASYISKKHWQNLLKESKDKPVVIFAGGSGSGKTSIGKRIAPKNMKQAGAILDGNFSNLDSALKKLEEVKKAGGKPRVLYMYREPKQAWTDGVVKRMLENKSEGGRSVPLETFLKNHEGSYNVIKKLNELGYRPNLINNSFGKEQERIMSLKEFNALRYNTDSLRKELVDETKSLLESGKITQKQYDSLIGPSEDIVKQQMTAPYQIKNKEIERVAEKINSGGITFDVMNRKMPNEGYVVSPFINRTKIIGGKASAKEIAEFLKKNRDQLEKTGRVFGGWYNPENGKTYLDVSIIAKDKNVALDIGKKFDQISIADIAEIQKGNYDVAFPSAGGTGNPNPSTTDDEIVSYVKKLLGNEFE